MPEVKRLILIDDDPNSNFLTRFIISKSIGKADVKIITQPQNALEYIETEYSEAKSENKTIILLELNMNPMSGWEFLDAFSEFSEDIKSQFTLYIFSSSIAQRDKETAYNYSCVTDYLEKPLSKEIALQIYFSNVVLKKNSLRVRTS